MRLFKIDLSEFAPLESYKSLNALFTRSLAKPRDLATTPFNLISPTDSLIIESGIVEQNRALQIKGMSYDVSALLGEANADFSGMKYINLYLSPKDYHHYHAPCDLEVLETRYFSGKLAPVNIPSLNKNDSLYNYNERVVLKMRLKYNKSITYYVAVVASGNDASVAMAEYIAGTEEAFVEQMNAKAASLGMTNTHFVDCCGLTERRR